MYNKGEVAVASLSHTDGAHGILCKGWYLKEMVCCLQVDLNKTDCTAGKALCAGCAQAWKATSSVVSVPIFFKDPMNINRIYIKQLKNSGVVKVRRDALRT